MLESAMNHFSEQEIFNGNGIQALINKLNEIKHNPNNRQLWAVNEFANKLALIDADVVNVEPANIRYIPEYNLWESYKSVKGVRFSKKSKSRSVVMEAYRNFCAENGINPN